MTAARNAAATSDKALRLASAGLLAWAVPGAGYLFLGERTRGVIVLVVIAATFWAGIAIGGIKNTVNPGERTLWFLGQVCAGSHALAALGLSRLVADPESSGLPPSAVIAYGRAEEVSIIYTAIAGMLNLLVILDVLARADQPAVAAAASGAGRRGGP